MSETNHQSHHADRVKEITDQLEQGITELFNSESYRKWLNTMSRFHQYSLNNTLLITMQNPNATLVAGYSTWQKQFGRQVKKGEKAIKILAPTPYRKKIEVEKTDPDTGAILLRPDGTAEKETREILHPAFRVVSVFDIAQTDGKELPTLGVNELTGDVEGYSLFFEALQRSCPVPIGFEEIQSGAKGYFHAGENRIALQPGMSEVQTIKTLIHEMTHQRLHSLGTPGSEQTKSSKELEAESTAYTVCQRYGIDTSDYSFGYIAGWSQDKDLTELKASLTTIRNTANELITTIDANLLAIQKERGLIKTEPEPIPDGLRENGNYRYYSTQRPVGPGTFPSIPDNKPVEIGNYDYRQPVENGAFVAWGWLEFRQPLTNQQCYNYELRPAPTHERTEKTSVRDRLNAIRTEQENMPQTHNHHEKEIELS